MCVCLWVCMCVCVCGEGVGVGVVGNFSANLSLTTIIVIALYKILELA